MVHLEQLLTVRIAEIFKNARNVKNTNFDTCAQHCEIASNTCYASLYIIRSNNVVECEININRFEFINFIARYALLVQCPLFIS